MTSSRLRYHALRGLRRSFSLPIPISKSQVHLTSAAVNGLPSCHLTPRRSGRVFHPPAVVDAVDHDRQPLDRGLTAGRRAIIEDDRPRTLFLELPVDRPYQLLALLLVGFHRLAIEQLLHRPVAISGDVEGRAAGV